MIRQLKIKFIAITMIMVSTIIIAIFSLIFHANKTSIENQNIEQLTKIILLSPSQLRNLTIYTDTDGDNKNILSIPLLVIDLNEDNSIAVMYHPGNVSIADMDGLTNMIETAYSDKNITGTIPDFGFRYLKTQTEFYKRIAFIDIGAENTSINKVFNILVFIGIATLLSFFAIIIILSNWALKPVEIAWHQQKQFIADASHELKTPLTVLLANIDILKENKDDTIQNQMKWINSSKQEAIQMKELLEEMLFLARSDSNKVEIIFSKINISDILISQILSIEVIAFEKNVVINYDNVQEELYANANEKQIINLFSILLENACKYSYSDTTITVSLKREQDKIKFEINNFGPVIPKTELPHIFERFYRVEKSRNKSNGGYGLGLSIAKKITDTNNMKMSVESSEQKGTSFKIIINRA